MAKFKELAFHFRHRDVANQGWLPWQAHRKQQAQQTHQPQLLKSIRGLGH
jgi:hypothetical protein